MSAMEILCLSIVVTNKSYFTITYPSSLPNSLPCLPSAFDRRTSCKCPRTFRTIKFIFSLMKYSVPNPLFLSSSHPFKFELRKVKESRSYIAPKSLQPYTISLFDVTVYTYIHIMSTDHRKKCS